MAELPPIPAVSVKGMLQADVAAGPDVRAAVPASRILHLEVEIRFFRAVVENHSIVGVYDHAPRRTSVEQVEQDDAPDGLGNIRVFDRHMRSDPALDPIHAVSETRSSRVDSGGPTDPDPGCHVCTDWPRQRNCGPATPRRDPPCSSTPKMLPRAGTDSLTQVTAVDCERHNEAEVRIGEPRRQSSVGTMEAAGERGTGPWRTRVLFPVPRGCLRLG